MEQLQLGYVGAVAAASGCILHQPYFDDGIDLMATHKASSHSFPGDKTARLEIQLKSTSGVVGEAAQQITAGMRLDRWRYFRTQDTIKKIVVVMSIPQSVDDWVLAQNNSFQIFHGAYWVNLSTLPDSTAANPTVAAPVSQVFDDLALCGIMERIGQGGDP